MKLDLPLFTSPFFYLGVFGLAWAAFHVLFLRWRPLGKLGWMRTEYFWVLVVLIGLVGTSIKVRGEIANGYVRGRAESAAGAAYRHLRATIGALSGAAVCRSIDPAEHVDAAQLQRQHDDACRFGRETLGRMPLQAPDELDLRPFDARPRLTNLMLLDYYRSLDEALSEYREARVRLEGIRAEQAYTGFDVAVLVISPILAAAGAALHVVRTMAQVAVEKAAARGTTTRDDAGPVGAPRVVRA